MTRLDSSRQLCQFTLRMNLETSELDLTPAPPELIAKAEALVVNFRTQCFWFWHPDATVRTRDDIKQVIRELGRNGNRDTWNAAQQLQRCL